ncbi:hypothetical protein Gotur_000327 [Gossypium turneri]
MEEYLEYKRFVEFGAKVEDQFRSLGVNMKRLLVASIPLSMNNQNDKCIWFGEHTVGQLCPQCQLEVESITHASCDCYFAKQVWGKLGFQWLEVVAKSINKVVTFIHSYGSEYRGTEICVKTPSSYCGSLLVPSLPLWVKINVDTGYSGPINKFVQEMSFRRVILESDSKIVILKLQTNDEDYSTLRPITWDKDSIDRLWVKDAPSEVRKL